MKKKKLYIIVVLVVILTILAVVPASANGGWLKCNSLFGCTFKVGYTGATRWCFIGTQINTHTAIPISGSWVAVNR